MIVKSIGLNRFILVKVKGVFSIFFVFIYCQFKLFGFGVDLEIVVFSVGCFVILVYYINFEYQICFVGGYIV